MLTSKQFDISGPIDSNIWSYPSPFFKAEIFDIPAELEAPFPIFSQSMRMPMLTGTYLETSAHLFPEGEEVIDVDPSRFTLVPSVCVQIPKSHGESISRAELVQALGGLADIHQPVRNLVVSTGWHSHWREPWFLGNSPHFTSDAVEYLAALRLNILGGDFPNFADPKAPADHLQILFRSGVMFLGPLYDTIRVGNAVGSMTAAPLKIAGVSATPVRAIWTSGITGS